MLSQAKDFHEASGKWSVELYKADIEMDLRTRNMAGFQLLDIQDYPGQGSAYVGILICGSLLSVAGLALVIFNGQIILRLNPLGDTLALVASLCWAVYTLLLRRLNSYGSVFITRKVFFYGLLTVLPYYIIWPWDFPLREVLHPAVLGNLLFLGMVASFACFALWSWVSKKAGALAVSNYVYLNPISTTVAGALVLGERLTWMAALGSVMILVGLYVINRRDGKRKA